MENNFDRTNPPDKILNFDDWRRLGRGRVLQFFATDDEVQEWLLTALLPEYGPYTLVGADLVQVEKKKYIGKGFEFDINELKKAMYELDKTRWNFWIRSKALTPHLDFSQHKRITWILSYSGLVGLNHGSYNKNRWVDGRDVSSIGIVDKVINDSTGQVIEYPDYLKIFNALKKRIKKSLCYSSFWKYKDGSEREDFKIRLMTEEAVRAYEKGMKFVNRPGRKFKK